MRDARLILEKMALAVGVALLCLFVFRPDSGEEGAPVADSATSDQHVQDSPLRTQHTSVPGVRRRAAPGYASAEAEVVRVVAPRVEGAGHSASRGATAISTIPAWTREEIADFGMELREAKDEDERMGILRRLLSRMTSENALAIRDEIHKLSSTDPAFRQFHLAFGALLGAQAVLSGADTPKPDIALAMQGWAKADPASALAWFRGQPLKSRDYFHQRYLLLGLVRGLAAADAGQATELVRDFAATNRGPDETEKLQEVADIVARSAWREGQQLGDPQAALAWAEAMPAGVLRNRARASIAAHYAAEWPDKAAAWVESFANEPGAQPAIANTARAWSKTDPEGALDWLSGIDNAPGAYHAVLASWGRRDAVAAGEFLVAMPVSTERDAAIRGFSGAIVGANPALALQWAKSIADPDTRGASYASTFQSWARKQPRAAEKHLMGMAPSATRDSAISGYAPQTARRSPQRALDWAGSIQDSELRDRTLLETGQIVFAKNPVAFTAWLPTSGLSPELQQRLTRK